MRIPPHAPAPVAAPWWRRPVSEVHRIGLVETAALAIVCGAGAGYIEGAILLVRRFVLHQFIFTTPMVVWMAPLAYLFVFAPMAFDHGNSLYRHAVHVPLVIHFPGHVPAGSRIEVPVSLAALPTTIMDLIGLEAHPFPGYSLAPLWRSPARPGPQSPVVSEVRKVIRQPEWYPASQGDLVSMVTGEWHYIRNLEQGSEEVYNVVADPTERTDLAGTPTGTAVLPRLRDQLALTRPLSALVVDPACTPPRWCAASTGSLESAVVGRTDREAS